MTDSPSTFLFRANKEKFDLRDQRKLTDSATRVYLASADGEIFVRELNAFVASRSNGKTTTAVAR